MGILDLMLGTSSDGDGASMANSYVFSKDTHTFVYPIAVRREEIEAVSAAIDALAETPPIEGDTDELQEVVDGLGEGALDVEALLERSQAQREAAKRLVETWGEQLAAPIGVVYIRPGTDDDLRAIVTQCTQRAEADHDEFQLPDQFEDVLTLMKRIDRATDSQYKAVVHTDLVDYTTSSNASSDGSS